MQKKDGQMQDHRSTQKPDNSNRARQNATNPQTRRQVATGVNLTARGEPFLWTMGGALIFGIVMIVAFLLLIVYNGVVTFYPKSILKLTLTSGRTVAGEPTRSESYTPDPATIQGLPADVRAKIAAGNDVVVRTLYKTGNFDFYNDDFKWVSEFEVTSVAEPADIFMLERVEWGPFVGFIGNLNLDGQTIAFAMEHLNLLQQEHSRAVARRAAILKIERSQIGKINHQIEKKRLALRRIAMEAGTAGSEYKRAVAQTGKQMASLEQKYANLQRRANELKQENARYTVTLVEIGGREKKIPLSDIVRLYPANSLTLTQKIGVYLSRWYEFLTAEPREANTEGGVMPAIFGTFVMTLLMVLAVAPFGVMAALYLREYAKQGRLVSIVRISVNNLAGVPSIVYGVFGLGFFAYIIGGGIDNLFFAERLPSPTFGTGGVLWASLTLALLTVPVVIVATEEALAAVPPSLREGSLACGASKWQTIKNIVLPKAMPGIMTGLILAMARGAGEVAPLMLVGVVKLAPELPLDSIFPFIHLERSFMHLGFHIFDVGFQSRNSEAGKPMVFVTTLLLITLVAIMNAAAIYIRNRLKRKYYVGHF